jgi:predicted SprT family Zn-dependent metalloprotease
MPGISRRQNTSLFRQLEFCFEAQTQLILPSAGEMRDRAIDLLRELKVDKLARRLRVEWNPRMHTTVGRADYSRSLISLNPALQNFGLGEIDRTLRHELAHLVAQFRAGRHRILPHGAEWRRACRDLGLRGERACHKLPLAPRRTARRFLYRCRNCQREFPRVRRIRRATACLVCCRRFAHGKYDERFRLQLANRSFDRTFSRFFSKSSH